MIDSFRECRFQIETALESAEDMINQPEVCKNCTTCGGCCQYHACDCHPYDFDFDVKKIKRALESGKYSIDFARNSSRSFIHTNKGLTLDLQKIKSVTDALYVRARNSERPIVDIIHGDKDTIEGPCIMWSREKGCDLSYEERPLFGKTVIPTGDYNSCSSLFDSRAMLIIGWKMGNFQEELFKIAKEFFEPSWHLYQELNFYL